MRCVHLRNVNESLTGMLHVYMQVVPNAQGDPAANPGPILPDRPPSDNEKHANVDHAGDKQNKTLAGAWLEKHFSGSAAAIAALGARGNRNRNTSTMPRIHQADAKRMPREYQRNTERMPRGMPRGCHVGHLPHLHQCRREYSGIPSPLASMTSMIWPSSGIWSRYAALQHMPHCTGSS